MVDDEHFSCPEGHDRPLPFYAELVDGRLGMWCQRCWRRGVITRCDPRWPVMNDDERKVALARVRRARNAANPTRLSRTEHFILKLLAELEEAYGLQLYRTAAGELKKGTVYVLLGRLSTRGFVSSRLVDPRPGEFAPRRVYRVTEKGDCALRAWAAAKAAFEVVDGAPEKQ